MSTYIFDFDGTLGDSMRCFSEAMRVIMERNGIPCTDELIKEVVPLGFKETVRYLIENYNIPYTADELFLAFDELLYDAYKNRITMKDYAVEYLSALKEKGHSINILSAGKLHYFSAVLKRYGIYELFDNLWSCDDFNMTKSNPQIYHEAVERAGGKINDSYFYDDNVEAIRAAVKAGIYTIGVYDKTSEAYTDEIKLLADKFIYSWDEMLL